MANVLAMPDLWFTQEAYFGEGAWVVRIAGSYASPAAGRMMYFADDVPPLPLMLQAEVEFTIDPEGSPPAKPLYFYIYDNNAGALIFSQQIFTPGDPLPAVGAFTLDLEFGVDASPVIGVTDYPDYEWGAPQDPYGYDKFGDLRLVSGGGPQPAACFWTDRLRATEDC